MDDTQRNLLGALGITLMLGGIAWAGSWWSLTPRRSVWWLAPAVAMFVIGAVLVVIAWVKRRSPEPSSDDRWFAISDRLGGYANQGVVSRFLVHTTTAQEAEEALNKYQKWILEVGAYLEETLGAAAHHRFNSGRGETSQENDDMRRLYDVRVQRLQYILDHRNEFPINPKWRPL